MSKSTSSEVEAAVVHGILFALHSVALVYNLRRGNRLDSIAHAAGVVYDGLATVQHIKASRR